MKSKKYNTEYTKSNMYPTTISNDVSRFIQSKGQQKWIQQQNLISRHKSREYVIPTYITKVY